MEVCKYFYLSKLGVHLYWQSREQHLKFRKRQTDTQQAVRTQNQNGPWRCLVNASHTSKEKEHNAMESDMYLLGGQWTEIRWAHNCMQ